MDWRDVSGEQFNSAHAELPRCVRFGGVAVRDSFADILSIAVMRFLHEIRTIRRVLLLGFILMFTIFMDTDPRRDEMKFKLVLQPSYFHVLSLLQ
jgi:hypothetical protein